MVMIHELSIAEGTLDSKEKATAQYLSTSVAISFCRRQTVSFPAARQITLKSLPLFVFCNSSKISVSSKSTLKAMLLCVFPSAHFCGIRGKHLRKTFNYPLLIPIIKKKDLHQQRSLFLSFRHLHLQKTKSPAALL